MTWSARVCSNEAKPGTNQQRAPFRGAPGIDLNQGSLLPLHPPQRLNPQQHPGPPRFCELRHTMYTKGIRHNLSASEPYQLNLVDLD